MESADTGVSAPASGAPPVNGEPESWSRFRVAQLPLRVALWWAKHAPRGKAAVPRAIGRRFGRNARWAISTCSGARLAVDPLSLGVYAAIHEMGGTWDGHILQRLLAVMREGDVLYDIGANVGLYSIEVAAAFGDRVSVHAFEPLPSLARAIRLSTGLNGFRNVHVHETALSDVVGETKIFLSRNSIHASLIAREQNAKPLRCSTDTIDGLVSAARLPPPSVMKLDVEGGELSVLRGARATIARFAPVILFEADVNTRRFGYVPAEICAFLKDLADYKFLLLAIDPEDGRPERFVPPREIPVGTSMPEGNYLALPPAV